MKRVGLIISIIFNIILLSGIGFLLATYYSNPNETKKEETPAPVEVKRHIVCENYEQSDMEIKDASKSHLRVEIDYDEEGTITKILSGTVVTYSSDDNYQTTIKEKNVRDLGNNTAFVFTDTDVQISDEAGNKFDMWVKDYVHALTVDKYQCK